MSDSFRAKFMRGATGKLKIQPLSLRLSLISALWKIAIQFDLFSYSFHLKKGREYDVYTGFYTDYQ